MKLCIASRVDSSDIILSESYDLIQGDEDDTIPNLSVYDDYNDPDSEPTILIERTPAVLSTVWLGVMKHASENFS